MIAVNHKHCKQATRIPITQLLRVHLSLGRMQSPTHICQRTMPCYPMLLRMAQPHKPSKGSWRGKSMQAGRRQAGEVHLQQMEAQGSLSSCGRALWPLRTVPLCSGWPGKGLWKHPRLVNPLVGARYQQAAATQGSQSCCWLPVVMTTASGSSQSCSDHACSKRQSSASWPGKGCQSHLDIAILSPLAAGLASSNSRRRPLPAAMIML